ncbi:MAG: RluA family pseudouridine synthase [Nitriliruptorales bacterium]|nr:RluA family pseudouridine synthase [Nitriliruptorales bacterium]
MRFEIGSDDAGERLDVALARRVGCSRSAAAAKIRDGLVSVDDRPVSASHRCAPGEIVAVEAPEVVRPEPPPLPPIRHRDDHLAVLAKPAGLVVHAGAGHDGDTLVDALMAAGFPATGPDPARPGIVHRLDRDTSGLMLVACSEAGHAGLTEQLAARRVERTYLAFVGGVPPERARLEGPIGRDPKDRKRFAVVPDGKPAATTWERLATVADPTGAVVACRLETGRTHQIRVHAASAGHPVAGDDRYGGGALGSQLGLQRMFLHAARLAFEHPVSGDVMEFIEPLPSDLRTPLIDRGVAPDELLTRL